MNNARHAVTTNSEASGQHALTLLVAGTSKTVTTPGMGQCALVSTVQPGGHGNPCWAASVLEQRCNLPDDSEAALAQFHKTTGIAKGKGAAVGAI